ncbi:MAG: carboxypeptidase regulatory-like domain-containing protein [Terriglobia bacterium]
MSFPGQRLRMSVTALAAGILLAAGLPAAYGVNPAQLGRVTGRVTDAQGKPLAGVTVFAVGPLFESGFAFETAAVRTVTDTHGRFFLASLVPGWYAVQVRASSTGPHVTHKIRVERGTTSIRNFVLGAILASTELKTPTPHSVLSAADNWKWILRTSACIRPILRFQGSTQDASQGPPPKAPVMPSEMMAGLLPGSVWEGGMNADTGEQNVYAVFKALSDNSDVLVAGALSSQGVLGSSIVASYRRDITNGNRQEFSVAVHQLALTAGMPGPVAGPAAAQSGAQAMSFRASREMRISDSLTLTTGLDVDYVSAAGGAAEALPHAKLAYQMDDGSVISVQYGAITTGPDGSLMGRVADLSAFPQMSMAGRRMALEKVNHAEARYDHALGPKAHLQVAVYHDAFGNTAVNAADGSQSWSWLEGYALPGPVADSAVLNAGRYDSTGFRAGLTYHLRSNTVGTVLYSYGDALIVRQMENHPLTSPEQIQGMLRPGAGQSVGWKITTMVPHSRTRITSSYFMVPAGSVTVIDPYGMSGDGVMPYWSVEIRQPLPSVGFLPAHFEAMADFTNVLGQGYVPIARSGEAPFLMSAACRAFRGGFSVQF